MRSVLADGVEQESSSQGSSHKHHYSSTHNCNSHSGASSEGVYITCRRRAVYRASSTHYGISMPYCIEEGQTLKSVLNLSFVGRYTQAKRVRPRMVLQGLCMHVVIAKVM